MSELDQATTNPAPARTPRWGMIELLQVVSVLAFAAAYFLRKETIALWVAVALGAICFAAPFLLVRPPKPMPEPEPRRLPEGPRGFKITRERRRILAALLVPFDILATIDESMLDVHYNTGEEMRARLYFLLGKARVRPWLDTILLHAKVYDLPEPADEQSPPPVAAPLIQADPKMSTATGTAAPPVASASPSAAVLR
jgi:hypothetical protein